MYTKDTVDHVVIDNEDMQKPLANDPEWRNVKEGETAWVLTGVDLDGKQQIITVYAENVTETAQYTLTATRPSGMTTPSSIPSTCRTATAIPTAARLRARNWSLKFLT